MPYPFTETPEGPSAGPSEGPTHAVMKAYAAYDREAAELGRSA